MNATPSPSPPLALLYLPPILAETPGTEVEQLGEKLAVALDRHASAGARRYRVTTEFVELRDRKEKVCRLVCQEGNGQADRPVADLYLLDYRPQLVRRHQEGMLVTRCLLAGMGVLEAGRRVVWQMFRPHHSLLTPQERFQGLVAIGMLAGLALYLAFLLMGVIRVLESALPGDPAPAALSGATRLPEPGWIPVPAGMFPASNGWLNLTQRVTFRLTHHPAGSTNAWLLATHLGPDAPVPLSPEQTEVLSLAIRSAVMHPTTPPVPHPRWPAWLAGFLRMAGDGLARLVRFLYHGSELSLAMLVALGLLSRERGRFTRFFSRLSEELLAFVHYFSFAERRAEITGLMDQRIEELAEAHPGYSRFAVLAYSFGSIVALDAFCPPDEQRARRLARVDTLVTIGSPYDFVLTYWPDYFAGRDPRHRPPARWLNVYSPVDVLGSRFDKSGLRERAGGAGPEDSCGGDRRLAHGPTEEVAFRENFVTEQLGWLQTFLLVGLRAHSMYWSPRESSERNCLHLVVPRLLAGEVEPLPAAPGLPPDSPA